MQRVGGRDFEIAIGELLDRGVEPFAGDAFVGNRLSVSRTSFSICAARSGSVPLRPMWKEVSMPLAQYPLWVRSSPSLESMSAMRSGAAWLPRRIRSRAVKANISATSVGVPDEPVEDDERFARRRIRWGDGVDVADRARLGPARLRAASWRRCPCLVEFAQARARNFR